MSKRHLLLTTAAAAALVGAMTTASMAFDEVTWDWTSHVVTNVTVTPEIIVPANNLTQVQKAQVQIGNVSAGATTATVTGPTVDPDADGPIVPQINTSATAVGNNQNVTSNTATFLNDGQFMYGSASLVGSGLDADDLADAASALFDIDNSHLAFGLGVVAGEALDIITPATITATSSTTNVSNVGDVSNDATAVANNTNATVTSDLMIADLTQVAVANVSASAALSTVTVGGNLNNHATAVGNNVNITVNGP
jgi:hypothetical protein